MVGNTTTTKTTTQKQNEKQIKELLGTREKKKEKNSNKTVNEWMFNSIPALKATAYWEIKQTLNKYG